MDRRIGAQLYTARSVLQTEEQIKKNFARIAEIGYKTIQVSGLGPVGYDYIKEQADVNGLEIVCTHMGVERYLHDIDGVIADHKTLGCRIAGIGFMPLEYRENEELLKTTCDSFNRISEKLQKEGIVFAYHNHAFEFVKNNDRYMMDYLIEKTDISFILDTYWIAFAGIDPVEYIQKLGKRACVVHFKDLKALSDNNVTMCEIGQGNLRWERIIRACHEYGAGYAMVEQDNAVDTDPIKCLQTSYTYLTKKGFI